MPPRIAAISRIIPTPASQMSWLNSISESLPPLEQPPSEAYLTEAAALQRASSVVLPCPWALL
jgi:hypothetical protein